MLNILLLHREISSKGKTMAQAHLQGSDIYK